MKKLLIVWVVAGVIISGAVGYVGVENGASVAATDGSSVAVADWASVAVADGAVGHVDEATDITDINDKLPEIYIRAINPGYTVDGKANVGEMIELGRVGNSDDMISLAGITVGYTNSSGNYSVLLEFPETSYMTGETLLLRLASSPNSEFANLVYAKTIAYKAGLDLRRDGEVLDAVCWTSKDDCYKEFKSASPTTLVRNIETGGFEHRSEYEPIYYEKNYTVLATEDENSEGYGAVAPQCRGIMFSEILSYYETDRSEQFIELYNNGAEQILLDGCVLRYKNKTYGLSGIVKAEGYYVFTPALAGFSLTKNPTNTNTLELIDIDGSVVDELVYPNGQRKGTAYAWIGYNDTGDELWRVTYTPTPGAANNYQEYKTCEVGKVINEVTGNCVKATAVAEKICKEGYYLNILTGRCKKYETIADKTCKEGYYLNPETGRCRKIVENNGADYNVEPENYEETSSFVALYAVLGVLGIGAVYLCYEFRHEIVKLWRRVFRRFR